jgi:glycosyltransferase involved in cell wall biosynthesis
VIYYAVADYAPLSWGVGMIYEHVRMLREAGYEAVVLHERSPFRPDWVDADAPVAYRDDPSLTLTAEDLVVVPEVLAADEWLRAQPWRRVVFVQGSFLIVRGLGDASDYRALGYERAMGVLPHVARAVERHFGVEADVVPPFVAPYFFEPASAPREKRVLFAVKDGYRALGIPDQEIARRLLEKEIARRGGWELLPLEGFTHRETAALMRSSMFLVNVFSHEAFNTTVPEAMAAGCVPVCYEAGGPRDFLKGGVNAIVFPNQDVYALVERVCDLVDRFDESALDRLRRGGRETAESYSPARTRAALLTFFSRRLGIDPR